MSMEYRVAVIGHTGRGNYGHGLDTVWLEMPNCQIVGVSDPDEAGRREAAKRLQTEVSFADYQQLLDETKPNIVAICPRWLDQHRDMVLAAAERGIHVYMEKPFCRNLSEADEIVKACQKHQIKLAVAHQTRYSPKLQVIRDLIADGKIGTVLEIRGRGKEDARGGGEDLWVLGSHVLNLMHHFGGDPQSCNANVYKNGKPISKADVVEGNEGIGLLAGDEVHANYRFENGIQGSFDSVKGAGGGRFGIQIFGSKGIIELQTGYLPAAYLLEDPNWSPGRSNKKWEPISSVGVGKPEVISDPNLHGGNLAACNDLIEAINDDRLPEADIFEARMTIELIAAVFESHRQQKQISIPLENRANPLSLLA